MHIVNQANLQPLSDKVRSTNFNDARGTSKDPCLVGPPTLEFAPYNRIPAGKRKNDARQGLIDQDAEFKAFLESLTNPAPKSDATASPEAAEKKEVTTTPLIEHLREKKAAKEKAAKEKSEKGKAAGKQKRDESKEEKTAEKKAEKKAAKAGRENAESLDKGKKLSKKEQAAKEAVKVLNKEAPAATPSAPESAAPAVKSSPKPRQRGSAALAAQMLQRDLGIGPGASAPRKKREPATADASKPAETAAPTKDSAPPTAPAASAPAPSSRSKSEKKTPNERKSRREAKQAAQAEKSNAASPAPAPTILKKPPTAPAAQKQAPPTGLGQASATAVPTGPSAASPSASRNAFLKHANPSQGITEPLIKEALSAFGAVESAEIDKRKGFAYATFETPEGLRAAIKGSPVKVAEGAVVVLERRETGAKAHGPAGAAQGQNSGRGGFGPRGGRGGRGRGPSGRGGNAALAAASAAPAANASAPGNATAASSSPAT